MDKDKIQEIIDKATKSGWENQPLGQYRSSGQIKQIKGFEMFVRSRDFADFLNRTTFGTPKNPDFIRFSGAGSVSPMGNPEAGRPPRVMSNK